MKTISKKQKVENVELIHHSEKSENPLMLVDFKNSAVVDMILKDGKKSKVIVFFNKDEITASCIDFGIQTALETSGNVDGMNTEIFRINPTGIFKIGAFPTRAVIFNNFKKIYQNFHF